MTFLIEKKNYFCEEETHSQKIIQKIVNKNRLHKCQIYHYSCGKWSEVLSSFLELKNNKKIMFSLLEGSRMIQLHMSETIEY